MCIIILPNLHTGHEMNRGKIKHFCVENMFILASEMDNLYSISDVYEMQMFAVF